MDQILHNALLQEQKLVTGRIVLDVVHHEPILSHDTIQTLKLSDRALNRDKFKQFDFETYVSVDKRMVSVERIAFDNRMKRVFTQSTCKPGPNNPHKFTALFDSNITKTLSDTSDKHGGVWVSVKKPEESDDTTTVWRQQLAAGLLNRIRQHIGVAKLVSLDALTGQVVVSWTNTSTHSKNTSLLTFETHNHYFLSRVQGADENGFIVYEQQLTPKSYPGDIVYPSQIVETYYYPKRNGGGVAHLHETSTLLSAELNIPMQDSEFDFGAYPRNARVSDSRFAKQFGYTQGLIQFTDTHLFQSIRDPDYLMKLELDAQQK